MQELRINAQVVADRCVVKGIDSVSELARRVDRHRTYVKRVLDGDRSTKPSFVLALAKALDVSPSALLAHPDADAALSDPSGEAA